jgi:hypothetical protein
MNSGVSAFSQLAAKNASEYDYVPALRIEIPCRYPYEHSCAARSFNSVYGKPVLRRMIDRSFISRTGDVSPEDSGAFSNGVKNPKSQKTRPARAREVFWLSEILSN